MSKNFEIINLGLNIGNFSLKEVNFCIKEHSYMLILGKIGSGKSVLLKTIAGLYREHSGEIWLGGTLISALPARERNIGYVPQHNDLFPNMNVRQNITFPLTLKSSRAKNKKEIEKKVDELIALMDIARIADRRVENLSGGERKKVAIARALASEPKLLLLDEPLGMLDAPSRKSVLDILRKIHVKSEISVIHVSHDRQDAWNAANFCAIMEEGRLEQFATTVEVFRRPRKLSIAEFVGCENIIPAKFATENNDYFAIINGTKFRIVEKPQKDCGYLIMRPELIEVNTSTTQNSFEAKILSLTDRGELCEIRILKDGIELVVHCGMSEAKELSVGAVAKFAISPQNLHCIFE